MNIKKITPSYDPWEAYMDINEYGEQRLTNVEFTTTNICNMRCEHCAVGYSLQTKDPEALPLELFTQRLDEVKDLRALSITGGEPMMSMKSVKNYVLPLLKYAHERGIRTQINSNLTMPIDRYELIIPYLDVLHISHNYGSVEDFADIGFAVMDKKPTFEQRKAYFDRMVENSRYLTGKGVMVSAETMINKRTLPHLERIHEQIVDMGCQRHEVHPMYPSNFASGLEVASLDEIREGIHRLLDCRDKNVWMLFGTLPFYPCNTLDEDKQLFTRLHEEKNVTVRNDPDGRSRLNVDIFNGNINVTDFADAGVLGHIQTTKLIDAYDAWKTTDLSKSIDCHCPAVQCLGPNLLVKHAYYKNVDFTKRKQQLVTL
ncbi:radical SAM/CxCxxxxC motif protein YfkAB [Evansella cellulosilytica]|uniref:YfkB-like domain-containing protein n=1 Tax=Evansella cellulosilytica (strain ATCC 21833 / DSM 2522 / FERM P-1141 / JCM 9156 / N-4) TaxID=649639 RepID=E6U0N4_EVAC2|nr:radical SAM/CxCxxxxC motif protein YfkAB [Evansella cellulosilytica]ADU29082.1 YfkB-like domain-containing protein [Evansella cellulosilytica DSM 2522]